MIDNMPASKVPGWYSEEEMKSLTGFGTTKLWDLRVKELLISSKIGNKTYYKIQSFLDLLEKNIIKL